MKFTVSKKEFAEALKFANKACAVKSNTPILSGIYLSAAESCLEIQATDNTVGIIAKIPASVEESGATVILGKKLFEVVTKLGGEIVTISTNEKLVEISSEGTKFDLLTFNADDFPKIKVEENAQSFTLTKFSFKNLVSKTAFAAAKDDGRPIFTGVLFKSDGEKLTLAATNTHRLAVMSEKVSAPIDEVKFLVPAKILQEISAMLGDGGKMKIGYGTGKITFTFDNLLVTARIIAGIYPPFERLLNEEKNIFATVDVAEFKNALERVAVIAKENEYETVALKFADNGLKIFASSVEVGEAEENISAEISGGELEIAFNIGYWLDVLKIVDAEKITIGMTKPLAPVDFQADNFHYVVTPVRRS